ncbi:MAG: asparagine synthase-related protein [Candidatus Methanoperedens sp.]|nr:asparagine synthase-related protein [Candidatus Methanoperedens sp.]
MPGLIGIISKRKENDTIENLLSKMGKSIKHEEWHKMEIHTSKSAGLGRVHPGIFNPEPQPIFNKNKTVCLLMDGEIYDYECLEQELIQKGHGFSIGNDPEIILHLYEEYGKGFVHNLNGSFTVIIWDEKSEKLIIANDRYGIRPLYYSEHNGSLLFGSEVKAILEDETFERIIDDRSVADFFSFGYILGNKTFFRGIELLPPASIMTYDSGRISIEQYWDFDFQEEPEDLPEEYYIEKSSKLVLQAVERHMKGHHRIGVPLSGGLDSRTIVASIPKKYYPVDTFTFGKKDCEDVKYAKMISDKLGLPQHFYEFKPIDLVSYAEKAVYLTDGMQNCIHAHRMQTYNEIREFMDVALMGWIGDSAMGDYLHGDPSKARDKFELFKLIVRFLPVDFLRDLFNENYFIVFQKNFDLSMNYILKIDEKANIRLSGNRLMYYNFKERQRRFISMGLVLARNSAEVRTPFSDYDFIDFILKIPPKFKVGKHIYKKMILSMFPDLADCPYQATGLPLNAPAYRQKANYLNELMKKIINEYTLKIFKSKLFFEKNRNFHDYDNWIRNNDELREYITGILLEERTINRQYFNKKNIRKILDLHISGKKDYSELIGRLLTFELWNRLFIDPKS